MIFSLEGGVLRIECRALNRAYPNPLLVFVAGYQESSAHHCHSWKQVMEALSQYTLSLLKLERLAPAVGGFHLEMNTARGPHFVGKSKSNSHA